MYNKKLQNLKSITVNTNALHTAVTAVKKNQKRITLDIDYNTKTVYIADKGIVYTIEGVL